MVISYDLDPMKSLTPRFTEEQLTDIVTYFDENCEPLLVIKDEQYNVITLEQFQNYLQLKKFHRREFHYPHYGEIMTQLERLKMQTVKVLTKSQFIYILDKFIILPEIKHEVVLAFKTFDTEKRSFLDINDIRKIVTAYGDPFTPEETRELLRDIDNRGDGNVYYETFVDNIFRIAPELYKIQAEWLYQNPEEDPSVPPEVEPEPEPVIEPPPPKKKGKKAKK